MSYYYPSNYHQPYDNNYHYNQPYTHYYNSSYDYNNQNVQNYDTQYPYVNGYHYQQHVQTPSLIGYYYSTSYDQHEAPTTKVVSFQDPVSTEIVEAKSKQSDQEAQDDLEFEEYNPEPYHGGYNMSETYGTPLPPSEDICYPLSQNQEAQDQDLETKAKPSNGVVAKVMENEDQSSKSHQNQEEKQQELQEEDEDEDEDEEEEVIVRRQVPPGYGLEAMDLCEGVFGGYFPCLWKRNYQNSNQGSCDYDNSNQSYGGNQGNSEVDYWKGTVDYLFGNPDPYGGSMPERGSYGDPVYSYQRYYPQQPRSVCEQVEDVGSYSWMPNSGYYQVNNVDY